MGYLVVNKDGSLPRIDDSVKKALEIAVEYSSQSQTLYGYFKRVSLSSVNYMKKSLTVLDKIVDLYPNASQQMKDSIERFRVCFREGITHKNEMRKYYTKADHLIQNEMRGRTVTVDLHRKMMHLVKMNAYHGFCYNKLQLETAEDRMNVIRFLRQKGKYIWALRLYLSQKGMLSAEKMSSEDERYFRTLDKHWHDGFKDDIFLMENEETMNDVVRKCRNPR
ncbi:hypothetical protein [Desmospora profundinema]|uniref:Uncharacterized protein n=1 Tax=Desmospora profundinema TaxID=1571184 RepID=A0ABU1ITF3_9BACL|nr:hypothetical protein [Desmospora profundinema]MDR6227050.1 hypothetical protein [Desmospora profundinema]